MRLIPVGSPDIKAAHKNSYVQTIVNLLLQDRSLLRPGAIFLKDNALCNQLEIKKKLEALRLLLSRPDASGTIKVSDHTSELIETLKNLYQQKNQKKINFQRGAIVELLICKLIRHRYNEPDEVCLNNQRFVDNEGVITKQEVDVAALSNPRRKVEGYECKVKPAGFETRHCSNLANLADAAQERNYRSHVGFVSFENDRVVKLKLDQLNVPTFIKSYGLDTIENLEQLSSLEG